MTSGRIKVQAALAGKSTDSPPKGEILITKDVIRLFGQPDLESLLELLNADLLALTLSENPGAKNWRHWAQKKYFLFAVLEGPFTLLAEKLDWMPMFRLLVKDPGEARSLMESLLEEKIPPALTALSAGCDGILMGDDLAGTGGLFASPNFFREFYFPICARLVERLEGSRVPILFHSDGRLTEIIPDLQAAGFWGIQGLQPSAGIRPSLFSEDLLKRWIFWGNFEFEGTGRLKSSAEVKGDVQELLSSWSGCPRYVFGSSGGLYGGLDPAAIQTAYDTVQTFNKKSS